MKKSVLTQEMTGCFARFIFVIAIEVLISIICIKGLGMSGLQYLTSFSLYYVLSVHSPSIMTMNITVPALIAIVYGEMKIYNERR